LTAILPYPVALVTGAARRIGLEIAQQLHRADFNIVLHYRHSITEAQAAADAMNQIRPNSVCLIQAELNTVAAVQKLAASALQTWGRIDVLVNNASAFYPTPLGSASEDDWNDLMSSNLKAPFFLAQALAEELKKRSGCIINIADIHAERPLKNHAIYCAAKAGNVMLIKSLARELAPQVRVNGIAPGAILWPKQSDSDAVAQQEILEKIPLQHRGSAEDIARTVLFLIQDAPYITGQIIAVDGGRSIYS
jgi:pteridine reductase